MRQALRSFIKKLREILVLKFNQYNQNLPYILTVVIALIIVVGGINLFIELTDSVKNEIMVDFDDSVTEKIISFRNPALTDYFIFVTEIGDVYGYLAIMVITVLLTVFIFKNWRFVGQIFLVLILATVSNMILKRFIDRARPGIEHMVSVETLSYPSGHAMSAMAFYGFVIYLIFNYSMNRFLKFALITVFTVLILSIGISRIYLGVHFPSDIIGGYIAGFIWVVFCILVFDVLDLFRRDPTT